MAAEVKKAEVKKAEVKKDRGKKRPPTATVLSSGSDGKSSSGCSTDGKETFARVVKKDENDGDPFIIEK